MDHTPHALGNGPRGLSIFLGLMPLGNEHHALGKMHHGLGNRPHAFGSGHHELGN